MSASKGFRNPTTKEMFLYGSANSDFLRSERLWNYELAWHHILLRNRLSYGLNLFFIHADNIIQTVNNKNINTGELKNQGIEAECSWNIDDHWTVNTNHSWLHMDIPVVSAPTYKGYLGGSWKNGKLVVNVGLMEVSGLYTAIGSNEKQESFTILNASVDYHVSNDFTLWLRGDNLLAQDYEYIEGMPMPKATFMGGIKIRL